MYIEVENLILSSKLLRNFELMEATKKLKIPNFRGVYLRDTFPKVPRKSECGIVKLDDPAGHGTDWVCWLKHGKEKHNFDSFGLPLPTELNDYHYCDVLYPTEKFNQGKEYFVDIFVCSF